jgi:phosphatidylglycerophosphate synthase
MWQIESTYKSRDVEEVIDIYFYRPVGYVIARLSRLAALTPNTVTILSIFVGVLAGHLFYYRDLTINVIGIILLVTSEAMDSADGQLARMTDTRSRIGRILDGFAGNLVFVSIYLHLCLRIVAGGGPLWIFLVAALCGVSHSFQCAMADYYRNAYLFFVFDEKRSELDKAASIAESYSRLSWSGNFVKKLLTRLYLNYTVQQETVARNFQRLYATAKETFASTTPDWFKQRYAHLNKPLLKYYNFITTNTRMIVLFIALLVDRVYLYFAFELIVLNLVLFGITVRQEKINSTLWKLVIDRKGAA